MLKVFIMLVDSVFGVLKIPCEVADVKHSVPLLNISAFKHSSPGLNYANKTIFRSSVI